MPGYFEAPLEAPCENSVLKLESAQGEFTVGQEAQSLNFNQHFLRITCNPETKLSQKSHGHTEICGDLVCNSSY